MDKAGRLCLRWVSCLYEILFFLLLLLIAGLSVLYSRISNRLGEVRNLPLAQTDCFIVKNLDTYYTGNIYNPFSSEVKKILFMDLDVAKGVKDCYSRYYDCKIIPVRVTITERKHIDLLAYCLAPGDNPNARGWKLTDDVSHGYGYLTD